MNKKVNYMNEGYLVPNLNSCQNEFQLSAKLSKAGISAGELQHGRVRLHYSLLLPSPSPLALRAGS